MTAKRIIHIIGLVVAALLTLAPFVTELTPAGSKVASIAAVAFALLTRIDQIRGTVEKTLVLIVFATIASSSFGCATVKPAAAAVGSASYHCVMDDLPATAISEFSAAIAADDYQTQVKSFGITWGIEKLACLCQRLASQPPRQSLTACLPGSGCDLHILRYERSNELITANGWTFE